MATKTISITEEAYRRLASRRQRENESFSEVINRMTGRAKLSDFFGVLSKESGDKLEANIQKIRKSREVAERQRAKKLKGLFK